MKKYKIKYWVTNGEIYWYVTRFPRLPLIFCIGSLFHSSYEEAEGFVKKLEDAKRKSQGSKAKD